MSRATAQRHTQILTELIANKHVAVRSLATELRVSEATVRRDLRQLAEQDELTLVHGGATLPRDADYSFRAKSGRAPEAKQQIGQLACQLVQDGQQIFLDSGTTCFQMATQLRGRHDVSVIAASVRLAMELDEPGVNVILLGGQYRSTRMDTVGVLAQKTLEHLRGYTAFIGADGLSQDFGPSASDIESAHLHELVVRNANDIVLLVDETKFAAASLYRIARWNQIGRVITNNSLNPEWESFFARQKIDVIQPED